MAMSMWLNRYGSGLPSDNKSHYRSGGLSCSSLIIAYSPCISHGIRSGMGSAQHEEAKAVSAGYWHLFRFDPSLKEQGKNPFQLDSRQPSMDYEEFLSGENRYNVLQRMHPEAAKTLFAQAAECAEKRFQYFNKLIDLYGENLL